MKLIVYLVLLMTISGMAQSKPEVSLGIEVNDKNQYRVGFLASNFEVGESFNKTTLEPASVGLAPFGAKIYVKNKAGDNINCGSTDGYTSANMSSSLSFEQDKFEPLSLGRRVYSSWLSIEDLLRGFKQCANGGGKTEDWKSFKIVFSVELTSLFLSVESDWYDFEADFLRRL